MKIKAVRIEIAMLLGMAITVFCAGFCGFADSYHKITDTVFRLHILANSDSDADQELKLKVRDAILAEYSYIFEDCKDSSEAAQTAGTHINSIEKTAKRVISENGYDYAVNCEVTEMLFDERVYDSVTMPAGEYTALRITIGDARGKNWWCVMFPPLCLPAVTDVDDVLRECGGELTDDEIAILNNPQNYECRFYILEILNRIFGE